MPDYVEVDIQSNSESDQYGFIRYRTGRDTGGAYLCETDYADAYLAYGIPSGTYVLQNILTFGNPFGSQARFGYGGNGFAITVDVNASSATPSSRGFELSVQPVRIITHSKTWLTRSGRTANIATEQELRAVSDELGQAGRTIVVSDQVTSIKKTLGNSADKSSYPLSSNLYTYSTFPCVGSAQAFSVFDATVIDYPTPAAAFPMPIRLSLKVQASYVGRFVNTQFITDEAVVDWFTNYDLPSCGRMFPLPLLIDIGGAFSKTFDVTETASNFNRFPPTISVRRVAYEWIVSREFSITAVRGRRSDGEEIPLT
jgi:hypothetical protein